MLEYLGAQLSEVIGWGWMDKVHPDDVGFREVTSWAPKSRRSRESLHDVVCRIRGADGRYRWFEVRGEPLRASDGAVLSWYGVLIDIDDRRTAEEALRESEYKLRQIIDTVPGLIWSTGSDGEPTHVSQGLLDYSGMRFEDFKHVGWKAFVHPDDFPETERAYYHAIQSGTLYRMVRLRSTPGGRRISLAPCSLRAFARSTSGLTSSSGIWLVPLTSRNSSKQAEDRLRTAVRPTSPEGPAPESLQAVSGWDAIRNRRTSLVGRNLSDILEYDRSTKPTIERVLQRILPR